jgi:hypothetical protein
MSKNPVEYPPCPVWRHLVYKPQTCRKNRIVRVNNHRRNWSDTHAASCALHFGDWSQEVHGTLRVVQVAVRMNGGRHVACVIGFACAPLRLEDDVGVIPAVWVVVRSWSAAVVVEKQRVHPRCVDNTSGSPRISSSTGSRKMVLGRAVPKDTSNTKSVDFWGSKRPPAPGKPIKKGGGVRPPPSQRTIGGGEMRIREFGAFTWTP